MPQPVRVLGKLNALNKSRTSEGLVIQKEEKSIADLAGNREEKNEIPVAQNLTVDSGLTDIKHIQTI